MKFKSIFYMICLFVFIGCSKIQPELANVDSKLFIAINSGQTGITFNNTITETDTLNYFNYPYLYMGGGVSIGDIDNDGLQDIFFTGNMVDSKLYKNMGNFRFEDITEKSGIKNNNQWFTGTTMVDLNEDGFLDIYVSVSGKQNKANKLYINNGDLTFTESASKYGLDNKGSTTQTVFFDYDNDNDLDVYIANYPVAKFGSSNAFYKNKMRNLKDGESDKLFRNDNNGVFTDVSKSSGVANYGLSLGLSVADYNNDGWQDIYVSNDFSTPDYLWINNGDGTFSNRLNESFGHTSLYAMGSDAADFNNDGLMDLIQVDMTPADNRRSKANMASMNPAYFWNTVQSGFHYQYMQNCLQLNRGNKSETAPYFSDLARMSGMATTDWSWAPLMADFDNDGWKDIFITNGTKRDVNNKDFFNELKLKTNFTQRAPVNSLGIPSEPIENYAYKNNGDLTFSNVAKEWGINFKGFSNGTTYADLDNDGDLDLVVNNMDAEASVYKNMTREHDKGNYLRFEFEGPQHNPKGIGTLVTIYQGKQIQHQQLMLTRGFQSSVEPLIHFGLSKEKNIDSINIKWSDGKQQKLYDIAVNTTLNIKYPLANNAVLTEKSFGTSSKLFKDITQQLTIDFKHIENNYDDYKKEPLLPHQYSRLGPGLAVADVNGDGLEDFFIGNALGTAGSLFVQGKDGSMKEINGPWKKHANKEDIAALFFDVDNDGDNDLYVGSGGNEFQINSIELIDKLYINEGNGKFIESQNVLPKIFNSTGCVKAADYDKDGDLDLFVGGRVIPGSYPVAASSYLLENKLNDTGELKFKDVTQSIIPKLSQVGLVTDAIWVDYDNDRLSDLIVCGEWMPIRVFRNTGHSFEEKTKDLGLANKVGWWYSIAAGDFDEDGDIDFIAGNLGENYKYQASEKEPFEVFSGDYDGNGKRDIVLGYHQAGSLFPLRGRECSSEQIPAIKYKFKDYESFSNATLVDVYGEKNLESGLHYQATTFSSCLIENKGNEKWTVTSLPNEAQFSSVNSILVDDLDADGHLDLIIGGNLYASEIETTRNDAGIGLYLKGNGTGQFISIPATKSGLYLEGDVKDMAWINLGKNKSILVGKNDGDVQVVKYKGKLTASK